MNLKTFLKKFNRKDLDKELVFDFDGTLFEDKYIKVTKSYSNIFIHFGR